MKIYLLLTALICCSTFVYAETRIHGKITEDLTLTKEKSPYLFGKTLISENVTLTIEGGVDIVVKYENADESSEYKTNNTLIILGRIVTKGSAGYPINIDGILQILSSENSKREASILKSVNLSGNLFIDSGQAASKYLGKNNPKFFIEGSKINGLVSSNYTNLEFLVSQADAIAVSEAEILMVNSDVNKSVRVTMSKNSGQETRIYASRLHGNSIYSYDALKLENGNALIRDSSISNQETSQIIANQAILSNNNFVGKKENSGNAGLIINAKNAYLEENMFESQTSRDYPNAAALKIFFDKNNCYQITKNTFRNNSVNIEFDLSGVGKNTLKEDINQCYKFEKNEFQNFGKRHIIITDVNKSLSDEFVEVDMKNNFWGNLSQSEIENSIIDHTEDFQCRLKINTSPSITRDNLVSKKVSQINPPRSSTHSLVFDGVDDYLDLQQLANFNISDIAEKTVDGDLTISVWIKPASQEGIIIDKRSDIPKLRGFAFWIYAGSQLGFQLADESGYTHYASEPTSIFDGNWHHIALTLNRNRNDGIRFYVDGKPAGIANPTDRKGSLKNNVPIRIGSRMAVSPFTGWFRGEMQELKTFDRALTPEEIIATSKK